VKGGKVFTPHPITGALRGISRGVVIKLCREQLSIPVEEGLYTLYDIYNADELFLTGTGAEAAPIVEADRRKIGDGTPGPVTRRIIKAFRDYAATSGAPVWPE